MVLCQPTEFVQMNSIEKLNRRCLRAQNPKTRKGRPACAAHKFYRLGGLFAFLYSTPKQIYGVRGPKSWENAGKGIREPNRMIRWHLISVLVFLCAAAGGCGDKVNDQDAIRASIERHLNGRGDLNLTAMDREVKQVSVNGNHASAQVEFRLKGSDAKMEIEYELERRDKEWAVLSSQPTGMGDVHSGAAQPPTSAPDSGGGQLPPGHPPAN
jgi:hypothetical protein